MRYTSNICNISLQPNKHIRPVSVSSFDALTDRRGSDGPTRSSRCFSR